MYRAFERRDPTYEGVFWLGKHTGHRAEMKKIAKRKAAIARVMREISAEMEGSE